MAMHVNSVFVRQALALVGWLALAFLAAAIGGLATIEAGEFYRNLVRPEWAPSASAFGPVWTVIYVLMGLAAWLVWREGGFRSAVTLSLFLVQLALNALWSWLFFYVNDGLLAFAELLVLWVAIAATLARFYSVKLLAGMLLVPYIAWVTFAGVLAWTLWQANPAVL